MERLLKNWSLIRVVHTVFSVICIGAAIYFDNNIFLFILGVGFLAQSLTNTGCSKSGCQPTGTFKGNYRRRH